MASGSGDITRLLERYAAGDAAALSCITALVYDELRRQARRHVRAVPGSPLQPTALVHEAWLKVFARSPAPMADRRRLYSAFANAMRQIVIDAIRNEKARKRTPDIPASRALSADLDRTLAVSDLLEQLDRINRRQAEIVRLRVFAGCSTDEIAGLLDTSTRTVERDWRTARAWLKLRLAVSPSE